MEMNKLFKNCSGDYRLKAREIESPNNEQYEKRAEKGEEQFKSAKKSVVFRRLYRKHMQLAVIQPEHFVKPESGKISGSDKNHRFV